LKVGQLSAAVAATGTAVRVVHPSHCPDIGPICQVREEPPQLHDQMFYVTELRPILEYQAFDHLSAELQVPLRLSATTVRYLRLDGTPFEPDYENIHHRNETLVGPADPWLSARAQVDVAGFLVTGRLGVTLPLGRTEENPFALGAAGLPHQHVQLGTGTFNPLIGLEIARPLGALQLQAYGQAQLSLYDNRHGYRAGARILGGVEVGGRVWQDLHCAGGVAVFSEAPERWDGVIQQDGNLGRTDVLVGASLAYPAGGFTFILGFKMPVYQLIIQSEDPHGSGQLTYPGIINLGVQRVFDLQR
jgi:hypothetical protein